MKLAAACGAWRDRHRRASGSSDAIKRAGDIDRKNDRVVRVPRATHSGPSVAKDAHRTSGNIDGVELSSCEETDTAAIGRPKREPCAICTVESLCACGREVANP